MKNLNYKNSVKLDNRGFTLIELLIVIVIIGILAAVVLGVLNPVQQQNRARDAALRSSLSKMAFSAKAMQNSSPRRDGRAPTTNEFFNAINNEVGLTGANCASNNISLGYDCTFRIDGITSGSPFVYYRYADGFRIGVESNATPRVFFVFEYREDNATFEVSEGFYSCGRNAANNLIYSTTNISTNVPVGNDAATQCIRL